MHPLTTEWPAGVVPANGCPHYITKAWRIVWLSVYPDEPRIVCRRCLDRGRGRAHHETA